MNESRQRGPLPTISTPLVALRAERKMSRPTVIKEVRKIEPSFPATREGLMRMEVRGTDNYWYIHALAAVYEMDPATVAAIARATQASYAPIPPAKES